MTSDAILDALHVPVAELAPDCTVRYANTPLAALSDALPSHLLGRAADQLGLDPARFGDWLPHAHAAVRSNKPADYTYTTPDRRAVFRFTPVANAGGGPDGVVMCVTVVDLTDRLREEEERRAVERQLLHAQKLDSLGVMAGGVAHDFNNLLTTILGNASLARMNVSDPSPVSECLRKVEGAAVRAAELCQQMLAYSGRGQFVVREVDLNAVVREVLGAFGAVVPKRAVTRFAPADPPPAVRGDAGQLRQMVLSLLANAADAVGDATGTITLSTATVTADAAYLAELGVAHPPPPGVFAVLEVSDTGGGMDEATRDRIFEPFFTTKFTGRGLGLSAVQGIVRGHRGAVAVASQVGRGTTFRVLLPVHPGGAEAGPDAAPGGQPGRGRTVLVAADEDDVRLVARRLLEANGFTVLAATDAADAAATFRNFHERVTVVLLDLSSPRAGGAAVFRELRRVRADVRVVLTSGYGRPEPAAGLDGAAAFAVLRKPFSGDDLLSVVVRAADG